MIAEMAAPNQSSESHETSGKSTVTDNTWQISGAKVNLRNPAWAKYFLEDILQRVCQALGTKLEETDARLHKLVLCSTGGQFEVHHE